MHLLLPYIIIIVIIMHIFLRRSTRNQEARNAQFAERESRANAVRRKDISNLNYISIPDNLPQINSGNATFDMLLGDNVSMMRSYNAIQGLKDSRILNLTGISNTDLKLSYGAANLTELTEYDDNFTSLAKNVASLGHSLLENDDLADAEAYLDFGVSISSDISSNYTDLACIYAKTDRADKISHLKECAAELPGLGRDIILRKLDEQLSPPTL